MVTEKHLILVQGPEGSAMADEEADHRPIIRVDGKELNELTCLAAAALVAENDPPIMFTRGGLLVRVDEDELGACSIELVKPPMLRGHLDRAAHWKKIGKNEVVVPTAPPTQVVADIVAMKAFAPPPLMGATQTPIIRPDGGVWVVKGYEQQTRLYCSPMPGFELPPISHEPTEQELNSAVALLDELVCDFPFDSDASKANMLALLITPVIRHLIDGPIPMAILDKPQPGTGATLLAELVGIVATGAPAHLTSAARGDREWRKTITSQLMAGVNLIVIDNVDGDLRAPALAQVLTTTTWTDRILGRSEMASVPQMATWVATGNNVRLGGDLPRRCYWIRMDAKQARPWQRREFKHPNLKAWALESRAQLIAAIITVYRYWIGQGRPVPESLPRLGSFEVWSQLLGGILHVMGHTQFLGNLSTMYEQADQETPQWEFFWAALRNEFGPHPFKAPDVVHKIAEKSNVKDLLPAELGDPSASNLSRRLGIAFSKRAGQRYPNGLRIQSCGTNQNFKMWAIRTEDEA